MHCRKGNADGQNSGTPIQVLLSHQPLMTRRHIYNDSRATAASFKDTFWLIGIILVSLTVNELPWKTKYVHWTVVACQPCAFRNNHVDNGFRRQAERNYATCRKKQRRPVSFLSVCWALQSSWHTAQNTINVNHRNDCRSGTFRLSEDRRWSQLCCW